jgi:hypothetical protein
MWQGQKGGHVQTGIGVPPVCDEVEVEAVEVEVGCPARG